MGAFNAYLEIDNITMMNGVYRCKHITYSYTIRIKHKTCSSVCVIYYYHLLFINDYSLRCVLVLQ